MEPYFGGIWCSSKLHDGRLDKAKRVPVISVKSENGLLEFKQVNLVNKQTCCFFPSFSVNTSLGSQLATFTSIFDIFAFI